MAGHHALTYDDQTAHLCASTSRPSQALRSSSIYAEASVSTRLTPHHSQQLPSCDLFATLLFDRQRAYQSVSNASSGLRVTPTSALTGPNLIPRPAPAPNLVSNINVHKTRRETLRNDEDPILGSRNRFNTPSGGRKRERPAEAPTKMAAVKYQKRKAPTRTSPRLAKRQMTEANGKKKVDNKGGTMSKRGKLASLDVIVISSDEEDDDKISELPNIDLEIDEDVKPIIANIESTPIVTENLPGRMPLQDVSQPDTGELSSVPPETVPSSGLGQDDPQQELAPVQSEHAQEVERLRQELDAARAEIERIQQLHDTAAKDLELEHVRTINLAESRYAATEHKLDNEQKEVAHLRRENESLRNQLDNTEAECDILTKEVGDEKALRTKEMKEHEQTLENFMNTKAAEMESATNDLLSENQRLVAEIDRLKAAATEAAAAAAAAAATTSQSQSQSQPLSPPLILPTTTTTPHHATQTPLSPTFPYPLFTTPPSSQQHHAPLSPAPSSLYSIAPSSIFSMPASTTDSQKDENIRRVYMRTKRRFDSVQSVALQLVHCTRGMDLSAWGEFGRCVGKLREVVGEGKREGGAVIKGYIQ